MNVIVNPVCIFEIVQLGELEVLKYMDTFFFFGTLFAEYLNARAVISILAYIVMIIIVLPCVRGLLKGNLCSQLIRGLSLCVCVQR